MTAPDDFAKWQEEQQRQMKLWDTLADIIFTAALICIGFCVLGVLYGW